MRKVFNKKVVACGVSILVLVGGGIALESLYSNDKHDQTSEVRSSSETTTENSMDGVSDSSQFNDDSETSTEQSTSNEGIDVDNASSSDSTIAYGYTDSYLEERGGNTDVVYIDSETPEQPTAGEDGTNGAINQEPVEPEQPPVTTPEPTPTPTPTPEQPPVATPVSIEQMIIDACNRYGIRSDIPLAIARLETGHFSSYAYVYQNNPGGMMYGGSVMSFASKEAGVEAFVSNLANNYFGIGLTSVESIGAKYCPGSQHWINSVYALM